MRVQYSVQGLVRREELWVTSKLWNTYHAAEHVEAAARRSLTLTPNPSLRAAASLQLTHVRRP